MKCFPLMLLQRVHKKQVGERGKLVLYYYLLLFLTGKLGPDSSMGCPHPPPPHVPLPA